MPDKKTKSKPENVANKRASGGRCASPCSRFRAAIKCVVRNLGGTRQFLLALGYIPSEAQGHKRGFWISPHNPNIMWKPNDAIKDHFTRYRWIDRAKAAEKSLANAEVKRGEEDAP
jgi:hypothetical protein